MEFEPSHPSTNPLTVVPDYMLNRPVTPEHTIHDLSPYAVARPKSIDELSDLMSITNDNNIAIAPRGGGTQISLGNPLRAYDLAVETTGLNKVVSHDYADLTATVEAGVTVSKFQDTLAHHRQFLAIDPPLPDQATIGGVLAVGHSGPMKWQYWNPRDTVIGMKVVQPNGALAKSGGRVVKNVSGYDMARLHIGGLGTLGIIVEVSFKLTPKPPVEATLIGSFDTINESLENAMLIYQSAVLPLAIVTIDNKAAEQMGSNTLHQSRHTLIVKLAGRERGLARQINECRNLFQCDSINEKDAASLWGSISNFGYDKVTLPTLGVRISAPPSNLALLTKAIYDLSTDTALTPALVAHPAHGTLIANWYLDGSPIQSSTLRAMIGQIRNRTRTLRGHTFVEHYPINQRTDLDVWDNYGGSMETMRNLKAQYDPRGTLNPGRFIGHI